MREGGPLPPFERLREEAAEGDRLPESRHHVRLPVLDPNPTHAEKRKLSRNRKTSHQQEDRNSTSRRRTRCLPGCPCRRSPAPESASAPAARSPARLPLETAARLGSGSDLCENCHTPFGDQRADRYQIGVISDAFSNSSGWGGREEAATVIAAAFGGGFDLNCWQVYVTGRRTRRTAPPPPLSDDRCTVL